MHTKELPTFKKIPGNQKTPVIVILENDKSKPREKGQICSGYTLR